ncbi:MAG TPA: adenylate/guanylate cyclase domain-containing protein [Methylomirabilota bacterium]|jgi:class 3 adenylate cyclase|nr:adenylate/guanylate cyclase domain-containing protein [Methylomirabilota bacterium]
MPRDRATPPGRARRARDTSIFVTLLGLALLLAAQAGVDQYRRIGRPFAGFSVMETLLVAIGGAERGGLQPFDVVRAVNGRLVTSGREIQSEVATHPPGTPIHYILYRRGQLVEADVATRLVTRHDFKRFLVEGLLAGLLFLALGALVFYLKPGLPQSWLVFAFCLDSFLISILYADAHTVYRFPLLFLTAWAFSPALFMHLALTFPRRPAIARRGPGLVWLPYGLSAVVALLLQVRLHADHSRIGLVAGVGATYWGAALILLVLSLARASVTGTTPLVRQRARVLTAGFAVGYLPPVLGTAVEALLRVPVPYLDAIWKLNFLFPAAVAYAMVRYNLFDVWAVLRIGTIYSVVTALVVAAYAGAIALLDLTFSGLALSTSRTVPAVVVALAVVVFLNPVYLRTQQVVDRVFFRQRYDVQQSLERASDLMTTLLDLQRIAALIHRTVDEVLHPVGQHLLVSDPAGRGYLVAGEDPARTVPADSPLPACLARLRTPVSREQLEEDPDLRDVREACLAELAALGAELVVPVIFQERVTGFLALGRKRSGAAYTTEDLRLLRLLMNQSAVALEHAKAYSALEQANVDLKAALRRVEILESIRSSLSKFVPRTVQNLIEQAPEAPELAKREADVSVLFVDIVGYTRLTERLDPERVNDLIERYFGAFLDEILKRGGDVNETAGDGLMVIFQDPDPRQHARAAVKTALGILRRTREINARLADLDEPIALHVGVNSGTATVGATKIEGRAGTRWTYTASGQVTNVAARLAALGEGDTIMVGPVTRSRLDGEFPFEDLGERPLRNVEHPVRVFRLPATIESAAVGA